MSRKEKIAWYIVWGIVIATVSFLVIIELLGMSAWPMALLGSWFVLCVLISPLLILRRRKKLYLTGEATDEREKMIRDKASLIGATAVIYIFWSACLILFLIYKQQGKEIITIKIEWLWWFVIASTVVLSLFTTITILVLRGRGTKNEQD